MTQVHEVEGGCVGIEYVVLGPIANNVYLISDGTTNFVVDPSCKVDEIMEMVDGRVVDAIVITHRHYDHVGAAKALRERTGAPVIASAIDAPAISGGKSGYGEGRFEPCPVDQTVSHGDVLQLGDMPWKVIGTPGHTPGGICLYLDPRFGSDPEGTPLLISGDTLFCGSIGRTDFEGGSMQDMRTSLKRLAALPDETVVLPGHDSLTCIANERQRVFAQYAR